jgi:hypothetical protein
VEAGIECHLTGTKAGRKARWEGCAFRRLFWNCAGIVLLRRWVATVLLSALSAKDFAEAIVVVLYKMWMEGEEWLCTFGARER